MVILLLLCLLPKKCHGFLYPTAALAMPATLPDLLLELSSSISSSAEVPFLTMNVPESQAALLAGVVAAGLSFPLF